MLAKANSSTGADLRVLPLPQQLASRPTVFWLLVCFTCSGMSGLIYEVSWVRSLELIFGTTTFAVATVLAAFMGGLACGSYCLGRLASRLERFHPLRLYAGMETLIAVVALLIPMVLQGLVPVYQYVWRTWHASFVTFSLVRFVLSALVLLVPTFLMGATLPVLSGFVSRDAGLGQKRIGLLYTFNTVGAVVGCVAAGLVLFPTLGRANSLWIAIGLNLAAAAGSFLLAARTCGAKASAKSSGSEQAEPPESATEICIPIDDLRGRRETGLLVTLYACSGFVAMLYEVAWSRVLVLALGCSTYAYTIMLATFLLGLALGAWLATRFLGRTLYPLLAAGLCQMMIALSSYLSVFLLGLLPFCYLKAYEWLQPSASGLLHIQFLLAAGLMILPTLGLGAMFPITIHGLHPGRQKAASVVGWAYALNTLGAIGGSVLAGFWLVPHFGSQFTLLAGIALNTMLAVLTVSAVKSGPLARHRVLVALLLVLFGGNLFYATPKWEPAVLSSGVFRYAQDYMGLTFEGFVERARRIVGQVLMFKEGLTCTITVARTPENTVFMVNGKPDASTPSGLVNPLAPNAQTGLFDLPTQTLFGQFPMLIAPQREQVLVIGLGSGITLNSVLTHPARKVECIELEDAVVRGNRFFEKYNHNPLADRRTELIVNDARNHLLVTDRKYDIIISEPSNPWIPGAANLFTREFFEVSKSRLQPNGVFCQWIQLYELQEPHFQAILRTFLSVFPEVHMFRVKHDSILVGLSQPRPLVPADLSARITPEVKRDLERVHVNTVEDLLAYYWIGGEELRRSLKPGPFNTDDNMFIEFAAPLQILSATGSRAAAKGNLKQMFDGLSAGAIPHVDLGSSTDAAAFWAGVGEAALKIPAPAEARVYASHSLKLRPNAPAGTVLGTALAMIGEREKARELVTGLEKQFPQDPGLLKTLAGFCSQAGDWAAARQYAERVLALTPDDSQAQFALGRALFYLKDFNGSLALLEKINPPANDSEAFKDLPFYLGAIYSDQGRHREAIEQHRNFLKSDPTHTEARAQLADCLYHAGQASEAAVQWQRVAQLQASQAARLLQDARLAWETGQAGRATDKLTQARALDPANSEAAVLQARIFAARGNVPKAAQLLETYASWYPDRPLVLGYLSQLFVRLNKPEHAQSLADRYHAMTGRPWEQIRD